MEIDEPGAGGRADPGRGGRPGGGTPSSRLSPYGRPQVGPGSRATRASGLATPGMNSRKTHHGNDFSGPEAFPGSQQAVSASNNPSTIRRFLTPIKAAGDYFFGSVGSLLAGGSNSPPVGSNSPGAGELPPAPEGATEANLSAANKEVSCIGEGMDRASLVPPANPRDTIETHPLASTNESGSSLPGLKLQTQTGIVGRRDKLTEPLPKAHDATPYSSVLQLLREGPPQRVSNSHGSGNTTAFANPGVATGTPGGRALLAQRHQTPTAHSLLTRVPLQDRYQTPHNSLFTVGITPDPKSSMARHRSTRSAMAKRTPVSAMPMLQYPSGTPNLPAKHSKSLAKPSVGWTPMRASTMAISEKYEKSDAASAKRQRVTTASPTVSSGGGNTPLAGSGISSLRSFAVQPQIYRRRVRPRKEILATGMLPPPAVQEAVGNEKVDALGNQEAKLTTATARRILMTLDTLAAKPAPVLVDMKPTTPKPSSSAVSTQAVKEIDPLPEMHTEAFERSKSPEQGIAQSAPAAGGWGDALLKANAASAASAAKAIEEEINKSSAGSTKFSFGASDAVDVPTAPAGVPMFGDAKSSVDVLSSTPSGTSNLFGSKPSNPSSLFSAPRTPTEAESEQPLKMPVTDQSTPLLKFGDKNPKPAKKVQFSFAPSTSEGGDVIPKAAKTSPDVESKAKPFGVQSPQFSFGDSRNSAEDVAVKAITSNRTPAGIPPEFHFQNSTTPPALPSQSTPALQITNSEQDKAAASVAEAASTPLPDDDDDDDGDGTDDADNVYNHVAKRPPTETTPNPSPAIVSSGGWGAAFLAANNKAAAAAAEAVQKEIEEKQAPPSQSPSAEKFSFGMPKTASIALSNTSSLESLSKTQKDVPSADIAISVPAPKTDDTSSPGANTGGGWGAAFLQSNAAAQQAAVKAVEKEIEKSKSPMTSFATPTTGFSFGLSKSSPETLSAPKSISTNPVANDDAATKTSNEAAVPAASGGWGSAFLAANKVQAESATAAAEAAIKEASGPGPVQTEKPGSTNPPAFLFGSVASTADSGVKTAPAVFSVTSSDTSATATAKFGSSAVLSADKPASAANEPSITPAATFAFAPQKPTTTLFSFGGAAAPPAETAKLSSGQSQEKAPPALAPSFTAAASPALFGTSSTAQPFGNIPSSAPPDPVPFGSTASTSFGFGSSAIPASTSAPSEASAPGSTFSFGGTQAGFGASGNTAAANSVFGASPASAPSAPSAISSFGGAAAAPAPTFGAVPATAFGSGSSASPSFGSGPITAPSFGTSTATPETNSQTFTFGGGAPATNTPPPTSFTFGSATAPTSTPAASPFGQPAPQQPAFGTQPSSGFSFGNAGSSPAPAFGAAQPAAFGSAPAAAPSFSFGAGGPVTQPPSAGPSFGAPAAMDGGGFTIGGGDQGQAAGRRTVKVRRHRRGR